MFQEGRVGSPRRSWPNDRGLVNRLVMVAVKKNQRVRAQLTPPRGPPAETHDFRRGVCAAQRKCLAPPSRDGSNGLSSPLLIGRLPMELRRIEFQGAIRRET
jgi:hypothetical protein